MEFIRNFEIQNKIHSVVPDALLGLFEKWTDNTYIDDFFNKYAKELNDYNSYHGTNFNEIEAKEFTIKNADLLIDKIYTYDDKKQLNRLFVNYNNQDYRPNSPLIMMKTDKKILKCKWLRIYAVKILDDHNDANSLYVITGGAIKLLGTTQEGNETIKQERKLKECYTFLKQNFINHPDDFNEILT